MAMTLSLVLVRENGVTVPGGENFTPGKLYANGLFFGFTCEDEERAGPKIYGRTAIPRGTYPAEVSYSHRFKRELPLIMDVPNFSGIRIHGGNKAEDSLGCILLGQVRTGTGIAQCAATVNRLISMIKTAEDRGDRVTLEIK